MDTKIKKKEKKGHKASSSSKENVAAPGKADGIGKSKRSHSDPASGDAPKYDRSWVTADVVVYAVLDRRLNLLLVQRKAEPFHDHWSIPGGFVKVDESLESAARRELHEETGRKIEFLEQLKAYGEPSRDPRTRVISVAFLAVLQAGQVLERIGDAQWFAVDALPEPLAFDHAKIVGDALAELRRRSEQPRLIRSLAPSQFTLTQLQEIYGIAGSRQIDKRNFRKWILDSNLIEPTGEEERGRYRPAQLYRFKTSEIEVDN